MSFVKILEFLHEVVYVAIVVVALYGIYCVILLRRQLKRRQFRNEAAAVDFVQQIRDYIRQGEFEEAENLATSPENWYRAIPLMVQTALEKRHLSMPKVRQTIAARFARDVVTSMESLIATVNTIVKCEPMFGLLGTVLGMIGAFSAIATSENPSPKELMASLSHAMNATAMGLISSIPLMLVSNAFTIRLRKMEDKTFEHVQEVLEEMEASPARHRAHEPARVS